MAEANSNGKKDSFVPIFENGRRIFKCLVCSRRIASKQNIYRHLFLVHKLSPVKPVKKLYCHDATIPVPKRTANRWRKRELVFESECLNSDNTGNELADSSVGRPGSIGDFIKQHPGTDSDVNCDSRCAQTDTGNIPDDSDPIDADMSESRTASESSESDMDILSPEMSLSDSFSDDISDDSDVEGTQSSLVNKTRTVQRSQALNILSCFLKHNLTKSACKDILGVVKSLTTDSEVSSMLNYKHLMSYIGMNSINEIHYCTLCLKIFTNSEEYQCRTENCEGLRYKGPLSCQKQQNRQPRQSFVMANAKELLKGLLETPGILDDIKRRKKLIQEQTVSGMITDINDGEMYKEMMEDGTFLSDGFKLTATINTDGVNLYSSSKIELWPIFLAINELSPALRFARENMLLIGLWQGKGKPPFQQFLECFSNEMNMLLKDGVDVSNGQEILNVKLSVVCFTSDLPAKAGALNMTQFNGAEACIACEETGVVVQQGRGHSRSYPYRTPEARFRLRNDAEVLESMNSATEQRRCKGFKGVSGLSFLQSFSLVHGTVPDYMHCVLLGIVKTLMSKWFSATESGSKYFIGKHLKKISERMNKIKPPTSIERLPRDLEKHYSHFKATELQAWLLYYAVPCLNGILDDQYLQHFACLSEAIYILLGDRITEPTLERAEVLLDEFYAKFVELYGSGSCGLNVHNAGVHMVPYVRKWGPIWAWSCFPFEDSNSLLLQSVHGTGNVMKQVLRLREVHTYIRKEGIKTDNTAKWKITHTAHNCSISGALKLFNPGEMSVNILDRLGVHDVGNVKKIQRIIVHGEKFYCSKYYRMKKRTCNMVLYEQDKIGLIQTFVLNEVNNKVYAIMKESRRTEEAWLREITAAKHIIPIKMTNTLTVLPVEKLLSTLVVIDLDSVLNEPNECLVAKLPNVHGHAVFK